MNQGILEVVKQEKERLNINTLGISELKWTGMGEFNSHDHYIYYCGQDSLRRNGVPIIVNKSPKCSTWMQSQKWQNSLSVHFQDKPFNITISQVYAPTSNAEEAEVEQCYEDLQDLLELTSKKDILFVTGNWNTKVGSQEIPGVTGKFGLEYKMKQANRVLSRERTGHSKHPLPTTQETTLHVGITTGSQNKTGSWLWLRSWLLIVKFRLKESKENHQIIQIRPKSNPLWSYSGSEK